MEIYNIDIRTTILLLAFGNLLAVALLAFYRAQNGLPALYAVSRVAQAVGWLLLWHKDVLPSWLWYVAGNTALFLGWAMEALALLATNGRNRRLEVFFGGLAALAVASLLLNQLLQVPLNTVNFSASVMALLIFCLPAGVLTFSRTSSTLRRAVGFFYLLFCCMALVRAVYTQTLTDPVSVMESGTVHSLVFLSLFALLIFGNIGYVLLLKEKADQELLKAASVDALTGVFNRRAFMSHAELAVHMAIRGNTPTTFLMLDIDHFKRINDTYGHPIGDKALQVLAQTVRPMIRPQDVFGRIGGEEFAVLLLCSAQASADIAERIRAEVERLVCTAAPDLRCTVSIGGTTTIPQGVDDLAAMMLDADRALYRAKSAGRNRVFMGEPEPA